MILAEIGDIQRFNSPKELVSYAGLCRGIYQSASTERSVRNTAVNKWLKWIIYECSGRAIMLDPKFQKYFYMVQKRKGEKTARRASARKMLTIIWYMLTNKEIYRASKNIFRVLWTNHKGKGTPTISLGFESLCK
jgi:transposase